MGRYVVLPRGINVGARNRVPMAALRAALEEHGFTDVSTILQSGNILLGSPKKAAAVAKAVETVLAQTFDVKVPCLVRSAAEIQAIIAANPLGDKAADHSRYLVVFLSATPSAADVEEVLAATPGEEHGQELVAFDGPHAFVYHPDGVLAMTVSGAALQQRLGVTATARNWNVLEKIAARL